MIWFRPYNNATQALKALSDGACAVVAGSLFHNITILGKNEKAFWSILVTHFKLFQITTHPRMLRHRVRIFFSRRLPTDSLSSLVG